MQNENLIPVMACCKHYNVEMSFIHSLGQYGFIKIISGESNEFIDIDELQTLEKFIRMHYELDINIQGIEAINFLLDRVQNMQQEITYLKSKLNVYENKTL
ncbi:MAG TPA: chaperone modulator CbpM [Parafilimonas sp.]|nr:chaperone modulator CbpM [Parafilimonas sp.]